MTNTYHVAFTTDVGAMKAVSFIADRIEFPRPADHDGTHIKFFVGADLVGSVNPEYVFMIKRTTSGTE